VSANAETEAQERKYIADEKAAGSNMVESVRTVAGVQSWRQRIQDFRRCDREATST